MQRWGLFWTAIGALATVAAAVAAVIALYRPATPPPTAAADGVQTPNGIPAVSGRSDSNPVSPTATPPDPPCVLAYQRVEMCSSHNPTAEMAAVWLGDVLGCRLEFAIQWGDQTATQVVSANGGDNTQTVIASHTYQAPGTYAVLSHASVLSGDCTPIDTSYQFTYL